LLVVALAICILMRNHLCASYKDRLLLYEVTKNGSR
jgi:hypothetical protein